MGKNFLPDTAPLVKQNDTRYGLDIAGQDQTVVAHWVMEFEKGLDLIFDAQKKLHGNADLYTAVWARLPSWKRTALKKILSGTPE